MVLNGGVMPLAARALSLAAAADKVSNVSVPANLSTRVLLADAYGYSMEPVWVEDYLKSDLATNLMSHIANVTGKPAPFRIGGNTADQTYLHPDLNVSSISIPTPATAQYFNISPAWYDTWANYFPEGTDLIYTLNLHVNASAWANALAEAEAVHKALGDKLTLFELGNEIDHFISKGWRAQGWDVAQYTEQWRNITDQILATAWYQADPSPPKFQAAVFADPPWVPDQQDELDDFDIVNLTSSTANAAGALVDPALISSYAVHLYPQSTCDTERWYRMRLDLLSNHTTLWLNVSQYGPQVAAADAAGAPLVLGETNSVSCSGRSGISDTFGAALWTVDYVLLAASAGIAKTYFHLGAQSEYSAFVPVPYDYKGESLQPGIRPPFYAHFFLAHVLARPNNNNNSTASSTLSIAALPQANASDLSGYAVFSDGAAAAAAAAEAQQLQKLVFLDMGVWNGTRGLSNPSTLSATDGTHFSNGTRPTRQLNAATTWAEGAAVSVVRLSAPGTNAKSEVGVGGATFDPATGALVGEVRAETVTVGVGGVVSVEMVRAEAVLLELVDG
ncbi:glycoside hydrolase family 79 protein [Diplodia corticola]|uniref:Glycoside hydrolase family 79 protein n=1 Tax=Diplodia corticola TaxID=236234 RepID=A0A1J9QS75_9PEZI|nr:glycoside hydrolase family 79 protein [Diplodia corticola]OJD31273.1 glycoside hydrolase family 79 protein [Diplodia corticola]